MSPLTPEWIDAWLSPQRFQKYLRASGGDQARALALYEWNAKLASCLLHDLGHLEIGIRNAYDRALLEHPALDEGNDWITQDGAWKLWAEHMGQDKHGKPEDKNKKPREIIKKARGHAGYTGRRNVHRGKVVAELMFGFWTYQTDNRHEKSLWLPALRHAYLPGVDRAAIHEALSELREVRNRLAHNESIFDRGPENIRRRIVFVARQLSPELREHINAHSVVQDCLRSKP